MSSALPLRPLIRGHVGWTRRNSQARSFVASARRLYAADRGQGDGGSSSGTSISAASSQTSTSSSSSSSSSPYPSSSAVGETAAARAYAASARRRQQINITDNRSSAKRQDDLVDAKGTAEPSGAPRSEPSLLSSSPFSRANVDQGTTAEAKRSQSRTVKEGVILSSAETAKGKGEQDDAASSSASSSTQPKASSAQQQSSSNSKPSKSTTNSETENPARALTMTDPRDQTSPHYRPRIQYPFNTHSFIKRLQEARFVGQDKAADIDTRHDPAAAIMEALNAHLCQDGQEVLDKHINKTEAENQSYLFKAALAELRTELQVHARNDAAALRRMTTLLQREVDSLNQRLREDSAAMKHDIQNDMNNRKSEVKENQNSVEQEIQDLQNRFTISVSDVKTEIEQSQKWFATRWGLTALAYIVVFAITVLGGAAERLPVLRTILTSKSKREANAKSTNMIDSGTQTSTTRILSAEEIGLLPMANGEGRTV